MPLPHMVLQVLEVVASRPDCDVGSILIDEEASVPVAVSFKHLKQDWQVGMSFGVSDLR